MMTSSPHFSIYNNKKKILMEMMMMITLQDLLGKAIERTPKVEQVNLNGGRLLREAKVCVVGIFIIYT